MQPQSWDYSLLKPWASAPDYQEFLSWGESNVFVETEDQLLVVIVSMDPFHRPQSRFEKMSHEELNDLIFSSDPEEENGAKDEWCRRYRDPDHDLSE